MAFPDKPTITQITWVEDEDPGKQIEPSAGKKTTGWASEEKPPFQWMNWLFCSIAKWIGYYEETTDEIKARINLPFTIIVGPGKDYETLSDALVDAVSGDSILIFGSETISTALTITQNNLRILFMPGVTFTKGGSATTCFILQGDRIVIEAPRIFNFTTGIDIQSGADFCRVKDGWFKDCTTPVNDASGTSGEDGSIYE